MTWPTSSREYKKTPVISFITREDNEVKAGDRLINSLNKKEGKDRIYAIDEVLNQNKSHRGGYNQFKCKITILQ